MAREGYLILDSDLHMMEPDDLWVRYLDEPHRANPPRFFGAQQHRLAENSVDKSNADTIEGMEVQGLAIPAHGKSPAAAASRRELQRRSRAGHPHFAVARARGFDPASTLTAMDIEGIDVAVMYGTRGRQILCHDDLPPDYAAALAAPTTTGRPITARPTRAGSNSPPRSRCTTSPRPSKRRAAASRNWGLSP
jgi:uncharacterized protein